MDFFRVRGSTPGQAKAFPSASTDGPVLWDNYQNTDGCQTISQVGPSRQQEINITIEGKFSLKWVKYLLCLHFRGATRQGGSICRGEGSLLCLKLTRVWQRAGRCGRERGSWEGVKYAAGPQSRVRNSRFDLFYCRLSSFLSDNRLNIRCKHFQRQSCCHLL